MDMEIKNRQKSAKIVENQREKNRCEGLILLGLTVTPIYLLKIGRS